MERVEYTPYGVAQNKPLGDFNGDGLVTTGDATLGPTSFLVAMLSVPPRTTVDWDRSGLPPSVPFDLYPFLADWYDGQVAAGRLGTNDLSDRGAIDNPVGYCGYAFNRESGDYCVRFRHYSPDYGRWLERDPAGYNWASMNLFEYGAGKPSTYYDPSGLEPISYQISNKDCAYALQDALRKLCPSATLKTDKGNDALFMDKNRQYHDKEFKNWRGGGFGKVDPGKANDDKQKSDDNSPAECKDSPGCDMLRNLESSKKIKFTVKNDPAAGWDNYSGANAASSNGVIAWNCNGRPKIKTVDGKEREAEPWEVLWHELIHASHDAEGTWKKDGWAQEEVRTIQEMNKLNDWYNKCTKCGKDAPVSDRDPYSHGPETEKLRPAR